MSGKTQEKLPNLLTGTRVFVSDGEHEGRVGVITDVVAASPQAQFELTSGDPAVARFAEIDHYVIRTRDSESISLEVKREELEVTDGANFGRITPIPVELESAKAAQKRQDQRRGVGDFLDTEQAQRDHLAAQGNSPEEIEAKITEYQASKASQTEKEKK